MTEQKQPKRIGIIAPASGMDGQIAIKLAEFCNKENVELIVIDSKEKCEGFRPTMREIPIPEIPKIEWQNYPETRAERRAKARKKNRK